MQNFGDFNMSWDGISELGNPYVIHTADSFVLAYQARQAVFNGAADALVIDSAWLIETSDGHVVLAYEPTRAIFEGEAP